MGLIPCLPEEDHLSSGLVLSTEANNNENGPRSRACRAALILPRCFDWQVTEVALFGNLGCMSGKDRRNRYDTIRAKGFGFTDLVDSFLGMEDRQLDEDGFENAAYEFFGVSADDLDRLFLISWIAELAQANLSTQIRACLREGWSWEEVGAALGVSRQAARKRFGEKRTTEI